MMTWFDNTMIRCAYIMKIEINSTLLCGWIIKTGDKHKRTILDWLQKLYQILNLCQQQKMYYIHVNWECKSVFIMQDY